MLPQTAVFAPDLVRPDPASDLIAYAQFLISHAQHRPELCLGCSTREPEDAVERKYRALARLLHPDKASASLGQDLSMTAMQALVEAARLVKLRVNRDSSNREQRPTRVSVGRRCP
jgi:hypothetical protein